MSKNRPPLKSINEVFPDFNRLARLHKLTMRENMIMSALFRVYSPEELALLFNLKWPPK